MRLSPRDRDQGPAGDRGQPLTVVVLLGPTASGKTAVLECLYDGTFEVVVADSMQAYRGMDIGTAKPSRATLERIPHHLMDFLDPNLQYTCGDFVRRADDAVRAIFGRGRVPVVSGGTAYYLRSFICGLPDSPAADAEVRATLGADEKRLGLAALHAELTRLDPISASRVHPHDRYRILRALEIIRVTGRPRSDIQVPWAPRADWSFAVIGLDVGREALSAGIHARVRSMLERGLVREVKALLRQGYGPRDPGLRAIGYREFLEMRSGCATLREVGEQIAANTARFAKRQMTFFRAFPGVRWVPPDRLEEIRALLRAAGA